MSPELLAAVKERIGLGHSREQIIEELKGAGYEESVAAAAYEAAMHHAPGTTEAASVGAAPVGVLVLPSVWSLISGGLRFAKDRSDLFLLFSVFFVYSAVSDVVRYLFPDEPVQIFFGLVGLVAFIMYIIALGAMYYILTHDPLQTSIQEGRGWFAGNLWGFFVVSFFVGIVTLGSLLFLVIPSFILSLYLMFALFVFTAEGKRGMNALVRSHQLVYGHWWQLAWKFGGLFLLVFLVMVGVGLVVGLLATAVGAGGAASFAVVKLTTGAITSILSAVVSFVLIHATGTLYLQLAAHKPVTSVPKPKKLKIIYGISAAMAPVLLLVFVVALYMMLALISGL